MLLSLKKNGRTSFFKEVKGFQGCKTPSLFIFLEPGSGSRILVRERGSPCYRHQCSGCCSGSSLFSSDQVGAIGTSLWTSGKGFPSKSFHWTGQVCKEVALCTMGSQPCANIPEKMERKWKMAPGLKWPKNGRPKWKKRPKNGPVHLSDRGHSLIYVQSMPARRLDPPEAAKFPAPKINKKIGSG